MRKLAKPCAPPGSSGIRTLEAIRDGKLPPGLEEWPILEEDDGFSSDGSLSLYQFFFYFVSIGTTREVH